MVDGGAAAEARVGDLGANLVKGNVAVNVKEANHGTENDRKIGKLQEIDVQDRGLRNAVILKTNQECIAAAKRNVEVEVRIQHILRNGRLLLHLSNFLSQRKGDHLSVSDITEEIRHLKNLVQRRETQEQFLLCNCHNAFVLGIWKTFSVPWVKCAM